MQGRIRLADRRQLLIGPRKSRPQVFALELLMVTEAYAESEARGRAIVTSVKQALIAHLGESALPRMYPDWFANEVVTSDITDEDIEDSEGNWDFTQSDMTKDEIEDVLASMRGGMSVSGSDTDRLRVDADDDEGGWV